MGPNTLPEPRPWQAAELAEHAETRKWCIFADPRTGKTDVAVRHLRDWSARGATRLLVSAPLRVCHLWENTLKRAGMDVQPLYNMTTTSTAKQLQLQRLAGEGSAAVINIDKLWPLRFELADWVQGYVCDEVHETASPSAHRALGARRIAKHAQAVRVLTGTPIPNHHGNLWSPLRMVGGYNEKWGSFMERYVVRDPYMPSRVIGHQNEEEFHNLMLQYATIVRREDVFGPDQFAYTVRHVELPANIRTMYRNLRRDWVLDEQGIQLTADHTFARMVRLQQLTSGFLPNECGEDVWLHRAKLDACLGDLGEIIATGQKAVVFHRFKLEGYEMLRELQNKVATFVINGDYDADRSELQRQAFIEYDGPAVIIVQVQSGSVGIDLSAAHHALVLSRTFSFVTDEQSRDRIFRPFEPRQITYYECPSTIDGFIAKALKAKRNVHDAARYASWTEIVGEAV